MKTAIEILQEKWGYLSFRPLQEEIISKVISKKDVIALLPTGGGKSICYQIPALLKGGVCIVICPLLALMQDQINSLHQKNIKAVALNKTLSKDEMIVLFDNIQHNNFKFLYLSPEKLQSKFIQERIKQLNVSLIAIDEAHCVSEWGHDFRPSYLKLSILKEICQDTTTIALTATATDEVTKDIKFYLNLENASFYKNSFKRTNLSYQVFEAEDKLFRLEQIFSKIKSPSIVYTNRRKETKKISDFLNRKGFKSAFYHGGLSNDEKKEVYDKWFSEEILIMVATNAFGMGIDKSNIRVVVHISIPYSIENYMQETGRAGRDGEKSFAVLIKNPNAISEFKKTIQDQNLSLDFIKKVYLKLNQYFRISKGQLSEEKFEFDFDNFSNIYDLPFLQTRAVLDILNNEGIIVFSDSFQKKNYLKFITLSKNVLDYADNHPSINNFIKAILRRYEGIFEDFVSVNEYVLSRETNIDKKRVLEILTQLQKDEIVKFIPKNSFANIQFLAPREDDKTINFISKKIKKHQENKESKARRILSYTENNKQCRSWQLLDYFGEKLPKPCGICDVCINKKHKTEVDSSKLSSRILELISEKKEISSREIILIIQENEKLILRILKKLLEEDKIMIVKGNKFGLK